MANVAKPFRSFLGEGGVRVLIRDDQRLRYITRKSNDIDDMTSLPRAAKCFSQP